MKTKQEVLVPSDTKICTHQVPQNWLEFQVLKEVLASHTHL